MKKSSPTKKKTASAAAKKSAYGAVMKAATASRKSAARTAFKTPPSGYSKAPGSKILVPEPRKKKAVSPGVVSATKLQAGISAAQAKISEVLEQLVEAARESYEISEIELSASFSADGKFLGFGVGGEMSITFRVKPAEA